MKLVMDKKLFHVKLYRINAQLKTGNWMKMVILRF